MSLRHIRAAGSERKGPAGPFEYGVSERVTEVSVDSIINVEPRQPGGCKLKTAPVRPVVAARPAEYVCSEDLFY